MIQNYHVADAMPESPDKCKKHRTYKAIRRPRVRCRACWAMFRYVQARGVMA